MILSKRLQLTMSILLLVIQVIRWGLIQLLILPLIKVKRLFKNRGCRPRLSSRLMVPPLVIIRVTGFMKKSVLLRSVPVTI